MRRGDEWLSSEIGRIREGLASIQSMNQAILQNQSKMEARLDSSQERIRLLEQTQATNTNTIASVSTLENEVKIINDWRITETSTSSSYRKIATIASSIVALLISIISAFPRLLNIH